MKIPGSVALVSGANRGLGRAYVDGLLRAGARRVYAAARDPATIVLDDPRIVPIRLDVTLPDSGRAAASLCPDVTLLINNAGVLRNSPALGDSTAVTLAAREEMETNFFGVMSMVQAFAPLLAGHGGGAIVNVLSVASWFSNPFTATYSASKAAAEALTDGIRIQLRSQGTQVVGVYAGFIDTGHGRARPGAQDLAGAGGGAHAAGRGIRHRAGCSRTIVPSTSTPACAPTGRISTPICKAGGMRPIHRPEGRSRPPPMLGAPQTPMTLAAECSSIETVVSSRSARGSRTWKVVPMPGTDSTPMLPPC